MLIPRKVKHRKQHHPSDTSAYFRCLLPVHIFMKRWCVGQTWVAFDSCLNNVPVETFLVPGQIWLAGKMCGQSRAAAVELSLSDCQIYFRCSRVAAHNLEFDAESLFQDGRNDRGVVGGP